MERKATLLLLLFAGPVAAKQCDSRTSHVDLRKGALSKEPFATVTPADCSLLCTSTKGCKCFTHDSATRRCWLLPNCGPTKNVEGFVSGEVGCTVQEVVGAGCTFGVQGPQRGMQVVRGPSWKWKEQDGGAGEIGVIVGRMDKCKKSEGYWWKVDWVRTGFRNAYRVGCSGAADIMPAMCSSGGVMRATSCKFNDLYWPDGAVPSSDAPLECARDGRVRLGRACPFYKQMSICEPAHCIEGKWVPPRPVCRAAAGSCDFGKLQKPEKSELVPGLPGCEPEGRVHSGGQCAFRRDSHMCSTAVCNKGTWNPAAPTCVASSGGECKFNVVLPDGATASGDGCTNGGTVQAGRACLIHMKGHTCEISVCTQGSWSRPAPKCTPNVCAYSQIALPRGATGKGRGCTGNGVVSPGELCAFYKEDHDCDMALCNEGAVWSTTRPSCRRVERQLKRASCQTGVQYNSNKEGNRLLDQIPREAISAERCATDCAATAGCSCFTWAASNRRCSMFAQCREPTPRSADYVSGAAGCIGTASSAPAAAGCLLKAEGVRLGLTVRRGPNWRWQDQDGGGEGKVVALVQTCPGGWWVQVRWTNTGVENNYRACCDGQCDLCPAEDASVSALRLPSGRGGGGAGGRGAAPVQAQAGVDVSPEPVTPSPEPATSSTPAPAGRGAGMVVTGGRGRGAGAAGRGGGLIVASVSSPIVASVSSPTPAPVARGVSVTDFKCRVGVTFQGGDLRTVTGVDSLDKCKQSCAEVPECVASVYHSAGKDGGVCALKMFIAAPVISPGRIACARSVLSDVISSQAVSAAVPPPVTATPTDLQVEVQPHKRSADALSVERVATTLSIQDERDAFAVVGNWETILLPNGTDVYRNTVTGAFQQEEPTGYGYNCSLDKYWSAGTILRFIGVPTVTECMQKCNAIDECKGFVHRKACPGMKPGGEVRNGTGCFTCDIKNPVEPPLIPDEPVRMGTSCELFPGIRLPPKPLGCIQVRALSYYLNVEQCLDAAPLVDTDEIASAIIAGSSLFDGARLCLDTVSCCFTVNGQRQCIPKGQTPSNQTGAAELEINYDWQAPLGVDIAEVDEAVNTAAQSDNLPGVSAASAAATDSCDCRPLLLVTRPPAEQMENSTRVTLRFLIPVEHEQFAAMKDDFAANLYDSLWAMGQPVNQSLVTELNVSAIEPGTGEGSFWVDGILQTARRRFRALAAAGAATEVAINVSVAEGVTKDFEQTAMLALAKRAAAATRAQKPIRYKCQSKQVFVGGEVGRKEGMAEPDACLQLCTATEGCIRAMFDAEGTCTMHSASAVVRAAEKDASFVACAFDRNPSQQQSGTSFTCEDDKVYVGGDLFTIAGVTDVAMCEEMCRTISAECDMFVFADDTCTLKHSGEAALVDGIPDLSGTACRVARSNAVGYECQAGSYVGGNLFQIEDVPGSLACRGYCDGVRGCAVAQYDTSRGCSLKSADAAFVPGSGEDGTTTIGCLRSAKPEPEDAYSCDADWGMRGGDLGRMKVEEAQLCLASCSATAGCVAAVYAEGECALKDTGAVAARQVGAVSCVRRNVTAVARRASATVGAYECEEARAYAGGDIFQLENVQSAELCKLHCTNSARCFAAVFAKGVCFLKSSAAELVPERVPGSVACVKSTASTQVREEAVYACAPDQGYYGGRLVTLANVDSLEACRGHCSLVKECIAVVHTHSVCGLVSAAASRVPLPGSTACVKQQVAAPAGELDCVEGVAYSGSPLLTSNVTDQAECSALCRRVTGCAAAVLRGTNCTLLPQAAMQNGAAPAPGVVSCVREGGSGWDSVPKGSGFSCERSGLLGALLLSLDNVPSAEECISHCRRLSVQCKAFRFDRDGTCSLHGDGAVFGAKSSDSVACLEQARGPVGSPVGFTCNSRTAQDGAVLRMVSATSSEDCLERCTADAACVGFSFGPSETCALKATVTGMAVSSDVVISCQRAELIPPASQTGSFHCSSETAYLGGDLAAVANVRTAEECQGRCVTLPGCGVALFTTRGTCFLKARAATPVPRKAVLSLVSHADVVELPPPGLACVLSRSEDRAQVSDAFRCVLHRSYVGGELLTIEEATVEECQAHCTRVPQCAVAVVGSDRRCTLRTAAAAAVYDPRASAVGCMRSFDSDSLSGSYGGFECARGADLSGGHLLDIEAVASAPDCVAHCALVSKCVAAVHGRRKGLCSLRTAEAFATDDAEASATVCQKTSQVPTTPAPVLNSARWSCGKHGYDGGDLFLLDGVGSLRHCQQQCAKLADCQSLVFKPSETSCVLKTGAAHAVVDEESVGCTKVKPSRTRGGAECACADTWTSERDGGHCGATQNGCSATPCDGAEARWCKVANPGCVSEEYGGWTYCTDSTPVQKPGQPAARTARALGTSSGAVPSYATDSFMLNKTWDPIGLSWREDGSISSVLPGSTADKAGMQVDARIIEVNGVDVSSNVSLIGETIDLLPLGTFVIVVSREVMPQGLIWYLDFAHLVDIQHLTCDVFNGIALPNLTDAEPLGGGLWIRSRVRAALNSPLAPFGEQWNLVNEALKAELLKNNGIFHTEMNPILQQYTMQQLSDGNVEAAASDPVFYHRPPVAKVTASMTFEDGTCKGLTVGEVAAMQACVADISVSDMQVLQIVQESASASATLYECDLSKGLIKGCLNADGQSIEKLMREAAETGVSVPPEELVAVNIASGNPLTGTDCLVTVNFTLQVNQNESEGYDTRIAKVHDTLGGGIARIFILWNSTWMPHEDPSMRDVCDYASGYYWASACGMCVQYHLHDIDRDGIITLAECPSSSPNRDVQHLVFSAECNTSVPGPIVHATAWWEIEPGEEVCRTTTTPAPSVQSTVQTDLPPADFTGQEDEAVSVSIGHGQRTLLQFKQKGTEGKPIEKGGVLVYDPLRRVERNRRKQADLRSKETRGRRAKTLQASTSTADVSRERCSVGVQDPTYGLLSNTYNVLKCDDEPVPQPLPNKTLEECIVECEKNKDCYAFSREGLNTSADNQPGECYLKRTALPYVGDQLAWGDWGTYITRCDTGNCTWTLYESTALHLVEEYAINGASSEDECREACNIDADCMGVSWHRVNETCYIVYDKPTAADHSEFDSYVCVRSSMSPTVAPSRSPVDCSVTCANGPGTFCFVEPPGYRCGCTGGFYCDENSVNCLDPLVPKVCLPVGGVTLPPQNLQASASTLAAAWQNALTAVLTNLTEESGSCLQVGLDRVEVMCGASANFSLAGTQDSLPHEALDASVLYVPVHSQKVHTMSLLFEGVNVENVFGNGSSADGIAPGPLESLRQQFAEATLTTLDGLTIGKICLERAISNEELICFDADGEPLNGNEPVLPDVEKEMMVCQHQSIGTTPEGSLPVRGNTGQDSDLTGVLTCPSGQTVQVQDAFFGRRHCLEQLCFSDETAAPGYENCGSWCNQTCDCEADKTVLMTHLTTECNAQQSCTVQANAAWLGVGESGATWISECPTENKYLWVKFGCVVVAPRRAASTLADAMGECAGGECKVRVQMKVTLKETDTMRVVETAEGSRTYSPAEELPAGVNGHPAGQTVDDSNVVADEMSTDGLPFVSEGLEVVVEQAGTALAGALDDAAKFDGACHEMVEARPVVCVQNKCVEDDTASVELQRTNCKGVPECTRSHCSFHGVASGFVGSCVCTCEAGYVGSRCEFCAEDFTGYPACKPKVKKAEPAPVKATQKPTPAPPRDEHEEVFHLALSVPLIDVEKRGHELSTQLLARLRPHGAVALHLLFGCRASVCVPECPVGRVQDWPAGDQASCMQLGRGADQPPRDDALFTGFSDGSVIELTVALTGKAEGSATARALAAVESLVGQPDSPLADFGVLGIMPVGSGGAQGAETLPVMGFEGTVVPLATLAAAACVCLVVFLMVYAPEGAQQGKKVAMDEILSDSRMSGSMIDDNDVCLIQKTAEDMMGVTWDDHTLVAAVADGSPAGRAGLRDFIGRRLTHINGQPVHRLQDIRQLSVGATELLLRFAPEVLPVRFLVDIPLERFDESAVVIGLAHALGLSSDKICVISVAEESACSLAVNVCFAGVNSSFAHNLLQRCTDPDDELALTLGISGGHIIDRSENEQLSKAEDFEGDLLVYAQWCDRPVAACSGAYTLRPGRTINGCSVWEKARGGGFWLFSTPEGRWCITRTPGFRSGNGVVLSEPHCGVQPEHVAAWRSPGGVEADIVVSTKPVTVQGFLVGERITSSEDVTERSRILVPCGQQGWVKGASTASGASGLRVRFDSLDRDVSVLPEEIDSAEGPTIVVCSPGRVWRECIVVNSNMTHIKVHYKDYPHTYDEWIENGSDRIQRNAPGDGSKGSALPVGSTVKLSKTGGEGCLAAGQIGTVIHDAGSSARARYKVRVKEGETSWYDASALVLVASSPQEDHHSSPASPSTLP
eukprot:Hpha_TRINITY_DN16033_c0_g10::TRINITY_DN16033_c0_g10_i2::g.121726::m.121726